MKKVIVLISFLCGAFFVSAQQGNQQKMFLLMLKKENISPLWVNLEVEKQHS